MSTAAFDRMTAEQLLARSSELGRYELIRGKPVMMTPPGGQQTLEGGDVLPDFALPLATLFDR